MLLDSQATAGRTSAVGVVEGEQPRLDFRDRESRYRAGELFGKQHSFGSALVMYLCGLLVGLFLVCGRDTGFGILDDRESFRELQGSLETLRQTLADIGSDHDAVDHHVNIVRKFFVE